MESGFSSATWTALGDAHLYTNNLKSALGCYNKATALERETLYSLTRQGSTLTLLGRYTEAIPIFNRVIDQAPKYLLARKGSTEERQQIGDEIPAFCRERRSVPLSRVTRNWTLQRFTGCEIRTRVVDCKIQIGEQSHEERSMVSRHSTTRCAYKPITPVCGRNMEMLVHCSIRSMTS